MLGNLGKTLSSFVFEPDQAQQAESGSVETTEQAQVPTESASKVENSTPIRQTSTISTEDQKIYTDMLERLNTQVYSRTTVFVQFNNGLKSLEGVIPDVSTRYKAAFAMLGTSGVNYEGLLNAVKVHTSDLASEVSRFNADSEAQLQRAVGDPTRKIEELNAAQNADHERLAQIQEQMNKRVMEINQIQQEMATAQNKVTTIANLFKSAESNVRRALEQADANIKTYLK